MGATTVAGGLLGIDLGGTEVALRAEAVGGSADRTVEAVRAELELDLVVVGHGAGEDARRAGGTGTWTLSFPTSGGADRAR